MPAMPHLGIAEFSGCHSPTFPEDPLGIQPSKALRGFTRGLFGRPSKYLAILRRMVQNE
jgi:hypothetical protein